MRDSLKTKIGLTGVAAALAAALIVPAAALAQDAGSAQVRVLHGAGDAPAVDIYADGGLLGSGLAFTQITDYIAVPGGPYLIQVVPEGATLEEGPMVIDVELTFDSGTATTVAATGSLAEGIIPQVISDTASPSMGTSQVRVLHLVADAPAVDIAPDGADALISDLSYPDDTAYLDLPAGAYDLEVRVAGTPDVAIQIAEITLDDGVSYSVFAIGGLADGSLTAVAAVDGIDAGMANIRVGHFSPDAPAVDVFANGGAILEGVEFETISGYMEVPAGTYRIQVAPAGAGADAAVIDAELTFDGGTYTTVAAAGALAAIAPVVFEDAAPVPAEGTAQLRAYHVSVDAPRVDIAPDGVAKKKAAVKQLKFGQSTGFLELPAGDIDLDIRQVGKKKVIFDIPALTLEDGNVYSAFAIGSPADGTFTVIATLDASL
jgi:hypothetical protein